MKLPRAQFGQIANQYSSITAADIAVYVIFRSRTLKSGYQGVIRPLLQGKASMFTNQTQFGLGSGGTMFRKMLVDLETMKIVAVDPAWGQPKSLSQMIQLCPKSNDDPPE